MEEILIKVEGDSRGHYVIYKSVSLPAIGFHESEWEWIAVVGY